jgi:hypothetical protein
MPKIVRFFTTSVDSSGVEINNIINAIKFLHTGDIQQITIRKVPDGFSGDSTLNVQIRYISGNSDLDKLVYLYESAVVNNVSGFVDSDIKAPFSCNIRGTDGDLHLYLESDVSCVVNIRVDLDISNFKL